MPKSLFTFFLFLLFLAVQTTVLQRCATPTAPTGGPPDTIGPRLVLEESTPNFQTNFRPEEIVLTFDEWVNIDSKQPILISPPLELGEDNQPQLRRRSLVINLEGMELRDSVTYVVNIDAAIKDLNEGNPTENLRFVFATGPVLDSASVSGTLASDYSGEPLENATFTLFSNLADTAVTTENPTYFAQTDEDGRFTVYNVRPGVYRAVALQRNPSATNYFFDLKGYAQPQAAGFVDSLITVTDGSNRVGTIRISPILRPVRVNAVDTSINGAVRLTMNQKAELVDVGYAGVYERRNEIDTLVLFYRNPEADTLFIGRNGVSSDTVVLDGQAVTGTRPFRVRTGPASRVFTGRGVQILFDRPLQLLDTSRVVLLRDTFPEPVAFRYVIDSADAGVLTLESGYQVDFRYAVTLLPGALTDWNGNTNQDTIRQRFIADNPENYGTLTLTIQNLIPSENYILRLLKKDEIMVATFRYIEARFEYQAIYSGLTPGEYTAELLYDSNKNRRYDSGDFLFGLQPEEVRRFDIEPLRANWEVEKTIVVDFDDPNSPEVEEN
ncbi:Ig-like domain-containing protein [Neolewinella antarctica]|uniref:SbsA Ig-like domain-containing protein n=1 Tax=Neolewinella antarctica TaxID=442734 RepID=A0ABX0X8D7_9BACT|nr:Ig-like domain-containing protein [Neolewinella antarctica]NJC25417.1 hypothetical protein [Neolewinella antarctica]